MNKISKRLFDASTKHAEKFSEYVKKAKRVSSKQVKLELLKKAKFRAKLSKLYQKVAHMIGMLEMKLHQLNLLIKKKVAKLLDMKKKKEYSEKYDALKKSIERTREERKFIIDAINKAIKTLSEDIAKLKKQFA